MHFLLEENFSRERKEKKVYEREKKESENWKFDATLKYDLENDENLSIFNFDLRREKIA